MVELIIIVAVAVSSGYFGYILAAHKYKRVLRAIYKVSDEWESQATKRAEMRFVTARLKLLHEESETLLSQLDRPNASSLHAKYKNDIVDSVRRIEEAKTLLYKQILDSGHDPEVSVKRNGEFIRMKLSEAIKTTSPHTPTKPERKLKIVKQDT